MAMTTFQIFASISSIYSLAFGGAQILTDSDKERTTMMSLESHFSATTQTYQSCCNDFRMSAMGQHRTTKQSTPFTASRQQKTYEECEKMQFVPVA